MSLAVHASVVGVGFLSFLGVEEGSSVDVTGSFDVHVDNIDCVPDYKSHLVFLLRSWSHFISL